ncbi:MAG: serine protein kinase [Candidatus Niyogibacteria bacterium CG10_big_fil_rev_8_21_14_0_10_42_19]|uniref:Serine protein kinase n=1 Tax=Candidatus Niyogibacteria bacterium CG10_big_fil_rev_8_21_14_0_10_42_19 TaxID=1974725 RepID=A0A2H0TG69_9BACT|nr:MAG: serine protein kinase [Candidatus Niyogibacteria bacterium CG10_big_fil_rev_8_21_14_0_10_42_19]
MEIRDNEQLGFHLAEVLSGRRNFENSAQSVSRMILGAGVKKGVRAGRTAFEFAFFRTGKKHIIGWFDEINDLVNFVKDAGEGGSSQEMAFVLVGEPGNGKTFFVEYLCLKYRQFISLPENKRYTFEFVNMDKLGLYGNIKVVQSQTFEDPMILAMNLFGSGDMSKEYLSKAGFVDKKIERLYNNHRPLGACTEFVLSDVRNYCDGDLDRMLKFIKIVPVPIAESLGTVTGKYSARDKITSSATDLLGEEDLSRLLNLTDTSNPYKYNIRRGAIARVGGGGIHFSDELFKNKKDLVQIYLQVIQNRTIELDGYRWPIDTLIIATSNNWEYNRFTAEKEEAPIKDRCRICYVSHNTDYKLQQELTKYSIGSEQKVSVTGENLHEDPNLNYAVSVAVTLTRLPHNDKLTPVEMMKLEAGETAGEKNVKTLAEIKEMLNASPDVTKRWGQKGIGHRGLGRIFQIMLSMPETHEGNCLFARDCFKATEREILDYITEAVDREKFMKDLDVAKKLYRVAIKTSIFNAYREDPDAIRKDVLAYVNMVIGSDSDQLGPDKIWRYRDPRTHEMTPIKIDERYIDSVETRLGLSTKERREAFRTTIRKIYGQKISTEPDYDFMDNEALVKAVTDVRLESDVAGAASLVGALANRANSENVRIYNRIIETMFKKLGYCPTCAQKTIEYFCEKVDES